MLPSLRVQLFEAGARAGTSRMKVEPAQVKQMIFNHDEFRAFHQEMTALFQTWVKRNAPLLSALEVGSHPKALIEALSEDLLKTFAPARLLDKYDVYQSLMTYWSETMQDDVYMIATEGWKANPELIPAELIVRGYFAAEQKEIEALTAEQEALTTQMEELNEEHGGEDGLLADVMNDKGKVTKGSIKARLKELVVDDKEEADLLNRYLALIEASAEAGKKVKDAQKTLDEQVAKKYADLKAEKDVKRILIEEKWVAALASELEAQTQAVASQFAGRIKELAERYAAPLPQLMDDVETLTENVDTHLQKMGFAWK